MGFISRLVHNLVRQLLLFVRSLSSLFVGAGGESQSPYAPVLKETDVDDGEGYSRVLQLLASRSLHSPTPLPRGGRKTLVLDLDETLIHSTTRNGTDYDATVDVTLGSDTHTFYVHKRPFADYFLNQVSKWYDVVIFTASTSEYASPVIDWLDPQRIISRRYYRESCVHMHGNFLKDLTIIEPDLARVFIIDNSPIVYSIVPENAIPIESWLFDRSDQSLLDLLPFLEALRFCEDVRSILSLRYTG